MHPTSTAARQAGTHLHTLEGWKAKLTLVLVIYQDLCKKNCSVNIQYKGDIVVVDIKQHKSQFKNSNFAITQSAKFFFGVKPPA